MRDQCSVGKRLTQIALALSGIYGLDHQALATAVTDCSDGAGTHTLRHVIANAASGDITDVSGCSLITLTQGEIASSLSRLRIQGNGSNVISGNNNGRILKHTGTGGYLMFLNVTLQNGSLTAANALGGCVYSTENVTFDHAILQNCTATETASNGLAHGGGIYTKGNVDLRNSVVTGNTATQQSNTFNGAAKGGGIYAQSMSAYNSVLSSNTANFTGGATGVGKYTQGGGAFVSGGARIYTSTLNNNIAGKYGAVYGGGVNVINSTISGNFALRRCAGVGSANALVLANSTVAFNSSLLNAPGGVKAAGAAMLQSSIVAKNIMPGGVESDLDVGSFDAASANNIIMTSTIAVPAGTITLDPRLLPLADNGGSTAQHPVTLTHALDHGSPAIDHGNITYNLPGFIPISCDQRGNPSQAQSNPPATDHCNSSGFLRVDSDPKHSLPDIGAYEVQLPNPDWIFYDGFGF